MWGVYSGCGDGVGNIGVGGCRECEDGTGVWGCAHVRKEEMKQPAKPAL